MSLGGGPLAGTAHYSLSPEIFSIALIQTGGECQKSSRLMPPTPPLWLDGRTFIFSMIDNCFNKTYHVSSLDILD